MGGTLWHSTRTTSTIRKLFGTNNGLSPGVFLNQNPNLKLQVDFLILFYNKIIELENCAHLNFVNFKAAGFDQHQRIVFDQSGGRDWGCSLLTLQESTLHWLLLKLRLIWYLQWDRKHHGDKVHRSSRGITRYHKEKNWLRLYILLRITPVKSKVSNSLLQFIAQTFNLQIHFSLSFPGIDTRFKNFHKKIHKTTFETLENAFHSGSPGF